MKSKATIFFFAVWSVVFTTSCSLFGFFFSSSQQHSMEVSIFGLGDVVTRNQSPNVEASVSGGTGSYSYLWSVDNVDLGASSSSTVLSNLLPGSHELSVVVTDTNSLSTVDETVLFEVLDYEEIFLSGEAFTMAWDASGSDNVATYTVYIREFGTDLWLVFSSVDVSETPNLIIEPSMLQEGEWEFGVSEVHTTGEEGDIHSSLDANAIPTTGWYLKWEV